MAEKTLGTFRVEVALWIRFKQAAEQKGKNASTVLIQLIQHYIDHGLESADKYVHTSLDSLDNSIDSRIDASLDSRIDSIDSILDTVLERLDKLEAAPGKLAA